VPSSPGVIVVLCSVVGERRQPVQVCEHALQRLDVAAVLLARPQHVCADDLQQMLARDGTPVSKARVYNTLGLFVRKGLARELFVDADKVLYDSNTTNHDHIYDVDTGALVDIEPGAVEVRSLPGLPAGTRVESVEVVIRVRRSR